MGKGGTDVAIEAADVVLMAENLYKIPYLLRLAKKTRRIVIQNLSFAVLVIFILGVFNFLDHLALPLGVLGHEGSTVLVILNGLRLLFVKDTFMKKAPVAQTT
jgi:Cd2+/Zn2+-exporting ATPase